MTSTIRPKDPIVNNSEVQSSDQSSEPIQDLSKLFHGTYYPNSRTSQRPNPRPENLSLDQPAEPIQNLSKLFHGTYYPNSRTSQRPNPRPETLSLDQPAEPIQNLSKLFHGTYYPNSRTSQRPNPRPETLSLDQPAEPIQNLSKLFHGTYYPNSRTSQIADPRPDALSPDQPAKPIQNLSKLFHGTYYPNSRTSQRPNPRPETLSVDQPAEPIQNLSKLFHGTYYPNSRTSQIADPRPDALSPNQPSEPSEDLPDILPFLLSFYSDPKEDDYRKAFIQFYSLILDSKPHLDPYFEGTHLHEQNPQIKTAMESFIGTLDPIENKEEIEALRSCCAVLESAQKIDLSDQDSGTSKQELADRIKADIAKMPIGSSYLIHGGSKKHAFLYEIIRQADDQYFLTIINTGDDQEWGSRVKDPQSKDRVGHVLYADKGYILTTKSMLDTDFIKSLLKSSTETLPASRVLDQMDEALGKSSTKEGRVHHNQKRGNCAFKSLNRFVSGHLNDLLGAKKGTALYKQFKVFRTQKEWNGIQKIVETADKTTLRKIFRVFTDAELQEKLKVMEEAYQEIYDKRKSKAEQALKKSHE